MIYIITRTKHCPGEPADAVSRIYYGWAYDLGNAEKIFNACELTPEYFRKAIWAEETNNKRSRLVKEEKYVRNEAAC